MTGYFCSIGSDLFSLASQTGVLTHAGNMGTSPTYHKMFLIKVSVSPRKKVVRVDT